MNDVWCYIIILLYLSFVLWLLAALWRVSARINNIHWFAYMLLKHCTPCRVWTDIDLQKMSVTNSYVWFLSLIHISFSYTSRHLYTSFTYTYFTFTIILLYFTFLIYFFFFEKICPNLVLLMPYTKWKED